MSKTCLLVPTPQHRLRTVSTQPPRSFLTLAQHSVRYVCLRYTAWATTEHSPITVWHTPAAHRLNCLHNPSTGSVNHQLLTVRHQRSLAPAGSAATVNAAVCAAGLAELAKPARLRPTGWPVLASTTEEACNPSHCAICWSDHYTPPPPRHQ